MMKKPRIAKRKEKITEISRKPAGNVCEQYSELLRLRDEIERLAASEAKAGQSDRS